MFFATAQSLDPREIDKDYDIYDARVGGGFPYTPPPPGCDTLGDKCAGPGAGGLSGKRGTENPGADGDADEIERPSLRVRGPSAKARRRAARSGKLALRVRLSGPGRVTATARSRFGGKTRKVGKGSKRLSKAGRAVVRVKLNKAARKRLRRGRALVLTVSVAAPGALTRTVDVRLERAGR